MMSSQLGRTILGGSASTADEVSAQPDQDGRYGPLDELLEHIAVQARRGTKCETIDGQTPIDCWDAYRLTDENRVNQPL